jgi:hypothetical protein
MVWSVLAPDTAVAQSFTAAAWSSTAVSIPFYYSDDLPEFPRDMSPIAGTYAPNINYRLRVLGNRFVRSFGVQFGYVDINPANSAAVGGIGDSVELGWYNGTGTPVTRTGLFGTHIATLATHSTNSGSYPGARLTFRTGPSWVGTGAYVESEDRGFEILNLRVTGSTTAGLGSIPTLAAHERVVGVLQANDDIVQMRLPVNTTARATVNVWLETPNTNQVAVWARCGSAPTAASHFASAVTWDASVYPTWAGASLDLPPCSSSSGWFISVTNTSTSRHVFHLTWGFHTTNYEFSSLRIGVNFAATPTELEAIRRNFQAAAWRLLAITGGSRMIRDFRVINGAVNCDHGPFEALTACELQGCDFCLAAVNRGEYWNNGPCRSKQYDWGIALCREAWEDTSVVIVHELGHAMGLPDEYHEVNLSCPDFEGTLALCPFSAMAVSANPGFCTDLDHRRPSQDFRGLTLGAISGGAQPLVSNSHVTYACNGDSYWTNHSSMWSVVNGWAPIDHPMDWSAHRLTLPLFHSDPVSGWFSRLE